MRPMSPEVAAQLAAARVAPALLVEIETDAGPVRAWTGRGPLTWDGRTFQGVGHLGGVGPVRESGTEVRANALTLTLSGVPAALISTALGTQYQGRPVTLWLAFFSAEYRQQVLALSPAGYWRLSEASGALLDLTANANHLTAAGGVTRGVAGLLAEDPDAAITLDGAVGTGLRIAGVPPALAFGTGDFWVAGLVRPASLAASSVLINTRGSWGAATGHPGWRFLAQVDGAVRFELSDGPTYAAGLVAPPGALVVGAVALVVATVSRTTGLARGYVNGVRQPTSVDISAVLGDLTSPENFRLGEGALGGSGFAGTLDDWACGAGALSDAQVQRLNQAAVGAFATLPTYLLAPPVLLFAGRADVMAIEDGPETATITVTAESRLADLTRPRERRYTDADQQQLFPGDRGLAYVAALQEANPFWGGNRVTIDWTKVHGGEGGNR